MFSSHTDYSRSHPRHRGGDTPRYSVEKHHNRFLLNAYQLIEPQFNYFARSVSSSLGHMSSHHFVKDGQEPALFIAEPVPFALAADLLEWVPYTIIDYAAIETVSTWGIKVDALIHNGDVAEDSFVDQSVSRLICNPSRRWAVVEDHLRKTGSGALTILCQRAYDIIPELESLSITVSVLDPEARWSRFFTEYRKWLPAGTSLRIYGNIIPAFKTGQIKQTADNLNVLSDGLVTLDLPSPSWIGELMQKKF